MAVNPDVAAICEKIKADYSPCDVSDALLTLGVPAAGFLREIAPIPSRAGGTNRLVAPISTVIFVSKFSGPDWSAPTIANIIPTEPNIPKGRHWTDHAPAGSVLLMQQPSDQNVALLGDIVATRLKHRGLAGAVVDGRVRDVVSCGELSSGEPGFQVWSKALSAVGTSLEAKPWAVDVPLKVSGVVVMPGDVLVADEGEKVCCVIPLNKLEEVAELLPVLKEADDGVLKAVQNGEDFPTAIQMHPKHYSNH